MILYYNINTGLPTRKTNSAKIQNGGLEKGILLTFEQDSKFDLENCYFDFADSTLKLIPAPPSSCHTWDGKAQSFVFDHKKYQTEVWESVKLEMKGLQDTTGFTWNSYLFDSTPEAVVSIQEATQAAILDSTLSFNWTLKNNAILVLTSEDMKNVSLALNTYTQAVHDQKETYREQIFSTYKYDELNAILTSEKFILT